MERESAEKVIFEMETQKNSQFVAASLGRGLHKLLIVVGSNGLESGIGVRLAQIPTDSCIVSDTQSAINMCPSQIWKPRFPNVKILEKGIELLEGTSQRYNFFETTKFYGIFSVTITIISISHAVFGVSSLMPERTTRWETWLMLRLCYALAEWTFWHKRWTIWHESGQIGRDLGLGTFIAILRVKTQLRILRKTRTLRKLR